VPWLAATPVVLAALGLTAISMPSFGAGSVTTERQYAALDRTLATAGIGVRDTAATGPVITNFPIWHAEAYGARALALPNETPADVVDLARTFGARYLVLWGDDHGDWPDVLASGDADAACFEALPLAPATASDAADLAHTHVYRLVCR
jgi:hypothetical protein